MNRSEKGLSMISNAYRRWGKRCFDIVLSLLALSLLAPVIFAVAGLVALFMGKPVLFRQQRPGKSGKPFRIYKFRTLKYGFAADGAPLPDEQRLTRFGAFLRSTSLDELPELWNVLKGEMSLVGPRPLLMKYRPLYSPEQRRRHEVRPGITGWAQIHGRNALPWKRRLALDVWYVDHVSFLLDMKILWRTFWSVFKREGITQPGHPTAEEFRGEG